MTVSMTKAVTQKEATASITVSKDRYRISLSLPEIRGDSEFYIIKHLDEGCGTAEDNRMDPIKKPWTGTISTPRADMPLQNPNQLQGSYKDNFGGTLSWNLVKRSANK